MNISINDYTHRLGGSITEHQTIASKLENILNDKLYFLPSNTDVDVYSLGGNAHHYNAGMKDRRVVIFNNATFREDKTLKDSDVISLDESHDNDICINGDNFPEYYTLLRANGDGELILDDNGTIIAEWFPELWELNILFNVFPSNNDDFFDVFIYILEKLEVLFDSVENKYYINKADNLASITNRIDKYLEHTIQQRLRDAKYNVQRYSDAIEDYKQRIKSSVVNLESAMRIVTDEESFGTDVRNKLLDDLKSIASHKLVKDIKVEENSFVVFTHQLNIISDRGNEHVGGEYQISIDMESTTIKFKSSVVKRSFWSATDPHPHVSGNNGNPCWGSLSSTIAELCAQRELYALTLFCIDFLQSANTEDPAGKNVKNWDMICPETGEILTPEEQEDDEEYTLCDRCGTRIYDGDDDGYIVYSHYDECSEMLGDELYVCQGCYDDYYYYSEEADASIGELWEHGDGICDCDFDDYGDEDDGIF